MKLRDIPKSGRDGSVVHCYRAGTYYVRVHVPPTDRRTDAQKRVRESMAAAAKGFRDWLTESQRQAWHAAAEQIYSRPRLGQSGPLCGEVLFVKLNCARALIGREWLRLPTAPVVFGPNPVVELTLRREGDRLRLELAVSGPVTEDIMVFATPPCRPTWKKCRKERYLGLLPAPVNGLSDITALYLKRFGEPEPGQRIFVRTRQQHDGWESDPVDTSNLVPAKELWAPVLPAKVGVRVGEHRTLNLEPRTLNRAGIGAWSLVIGASSSPCPWDVHAVYTVVAPWPGAPRRGHAARIRRARRPWGLCQLGQTARNGPWHELWHHR
jgi:hypothetical protein